MPLALASRSTLIAPSATLAMAAEAKRLKSQGVEVLDFALGEPDFNTPANIQEAAIRAMRSGQTHYTPPAGIPELRPAVAELYTKQHGLPTEPAQVVISNGAKHSIHNALMAVCGPGDEVIIPAPYWVSYSDLVKLTGATPVVLPTTEESGFKLTPEQFLAAVDAADQAADDQQPVQSDRRGLRSRRADGAGRRGPADRCRRPLRRDLRAIDLRRRPADLLRDAAARPGRADDHDLGRQQDLRDDRLADGLGGRAGAGGQVHGRPPEPGDEQPLLDQPVGGPRGDHRPAGFGRRDEGRVRQAPRVCPGADHAAPGGALPAARAGRSTRS